MPRTDYENLIRAFGARIGLDELAPDGDEPLTLTVDDAILHLELDASGQLQIWSVLRGLVAEGAVLKKAMELNFAFAFQGMPTIVADRASGELLLARADSLQGRDAEWLETRIAAFLTVHRLARGIGSTEPPPESATLQFSDFMIRL